MSSVARPIERDETSGPPVGLGGAPRLIRPEKVTEFYYVLGLIALLLRKNKKMAELFPQD